MADGRQGADLGSEGAGGLSEKRKPAELVPKIFPKTKRINIIKYNKNNNKQ